MGVRCGTTPAMPTYVKRPWKKLSEAKPTSYFMKKFELDLVSTGSFSF